MYGDKIVILAFRFLLVLLRIMLHQIFNCASTGSRAADGGGGGGSNYFDGCVRDTHSALGGESRHLCLLTYYLRFVIVAIDFLIFIFLLLVLDI